MNPAALMALLNGDTKNTTAASTPGGIEAQEAQGQQELVNSTQVPKEILHSTKEPFEKIGFIFGEEADDIFVNCKLPEGWTRKGTDHNMWSEICDEKERVRVNVFYKAAFYDRKAHMSLKDFITVDRNREDNWEGKGEDYLFIGTVKAGGDVVFETGPIEYDEAYNKAKSWAKENYPDYEDPTKYWD
jgi:hypothetical protein